MLSHQIRFISIGDEYDSACADDRHAVAWEMKFIINEAYSADIGKKVKAVWDTYMRMGRYIGGRAPYGYCKASDDCHRLEVDPQTAPAVKKIFELAAMGETPSAIARFLNTAKIPTPSMYQLSNEMIGSAKVTSRFWHAETVAGILKNEVYTGNLAQGKTKTVYHKRKPVAPEHWIRAENTHTAIVSDELFEQAQKEVQNLRPRTSSTPYTPNLFRGKIYCACCGSRLERKKNHQKYIYRCKTVYDAPDACTGVRIDEDSLLAAISESLHQCSKVAASDEDFFVQEKPNPSLLIRRQSEDKRDVELLKKQYGDYMNGMMNKSTFERFQKERRSRQLLRAQEISRLMLTQKNLAAIEVRRRELKDALDEFERLGELTLKLVEILIERIEVLGDGRVYVGIRNADCV